MRTCLLDIHLEVASFVLLALRVSEQRKGDLKRLPSATRGLKLLVVGGGGHPPLRVFGDISETAGATMLKFADFS